MYDLYDSMFLSVYFWFKQVYRAPTFLTTIISSYFIRSCVHCALYSYHEAGVGCHTVSDGLDAAVRQEDGVLPGHAPPVTRLLLVKVVPLPILVLKELFMLNL